MCFGPSITHTKVHLNQTSNNSFILEKLVKILRSVTPFALHFSACYVVEECLYAAGDDTWLTAA